MPEQADCFTAHPGDLDSVFTALVSFLAPDPFLLSGVVTTFEICFHARNEMFWDQ